MENFRELEKELKRKQFSKKSLQHSGKGRRGGDGSSDDDGSGDDDSDMDEDSNEDGESDGIDENDMLDGEFDDADMMDNSEENKSNQLSETFMEDKPEERKKNCDYLNDAFLFMKNLV